MTVLNTLYLHDAAYSGGGTMPSAATQSATTPGVTATGAGTNRTMDNNKGAVQVSATLASLAQTAAQNNWLRRFVSLPLSAQTLNFGAGQVGVRLANATSNTTNSQWGIKYGLLFVWRPSTGVKVGTIFDSVTLGVGNASSSTSEVWQSSGFNPSVTSVTCAAGDVLIYELWGGVTQGMATSYTWTWWYDGSQDWTADGSAVLTAASALILGTTGADFVVPVVAQPPREPKVIGAAVRDAATRCWSRRRSGIVVPRLWTPEGATI